jgi:hypothetical protein
MHHSVLRKGGLALYMQKDNELENKNELCILNKLISHSCNTIYSYEGNAYCLKAIKCSTVWCE